MGFKCRFLSSHIEKLCEGQGCQGLGSTLAFLPERLRAVAPISLATDSDRLQWLYETRGETNVIGPDVIRRVRNSKGEAIPITKAYLASIGEELDTRQNPDGRGKGRTRGRRNTRNECVGRSDQKNRQDAENVEGSDHSPCDVQPRNGGNQEEGENGYQPDVQDGHNATLAMLGDNQDFPDVPLRSVEKKRLRFEGGMYLAPLTTVGNLPFRRLCTAFGADITCGEMGLAQEYMSGNKNEWSLVRRHSNEKLFGVQLCGNKPQTLVAATEILKNECPNIDFIDVNLGCPIDLVIKKGAGSALLDHANKLGKILHGMNLASGDIPITIKMRTGIKTGVNTTHKLMARAIKDWGVGAVTVRQVQLHRDSRCDQPMPDSWPHTTAEILQIGRL